MSIFENEKNKNIGEKKEKITVVIIDNENLRGSIKKIYPQKNIDYLHFIKFLKEKFARDSNLRIYLVVSLLGIEKKENFSPGMLSFLRTMKNLEIGYEMNKEIDFKVVEVSAKRERVYLLDQKNFGMAEISQVDQKIFNIFMKESLNSCIRRKCRFVLVSGDGDFLETLTHIKKYVTEDIKIISSKRSCNDILKRVFDVMFIEDILKENPNVLFKKEENK